MTMVSRVASSASTTSTLPAGLMPGPSTARMVEISAPVPTGLTRKLAAPRRSPPASGSGLEVKKSTGMLSVLRSCFSTMATSRAAGPPALTSRRARPQPEVPPDPLNRLPTAGQVELVPGRRVGGAAPLQFLHQLIQQARPHRSCRQPHAELGRGNFAPSFRSGTGEAGGDFSPHPHLALASCGNRQLQQAGGYLYQPGMLSLYGREGRRVLGDNRDRLLRGAAGSRLHGVFNHQGQ